ncbi:response regulator [Devosia rhodophyticola]|uniref:Response regulator n=1 Tax=Devosia rhodophyticola TaxID=3026423 RepID=A0ABY7Z2J7_9HYPH|nr:response regulator [Devosia rhodophyticola]WDR07215.1 response regulator [Devosia rhodophyticola]
MMIPENCGVLVVEDEPLVALMIEDMLRDMGGAQIHVAHDQDSARASLEQHAPRLAVMDFNLGQNDSMSLVDACRGRGIAVIIASGYSADDLPLEVRTLPLLPKPFSFEQMSDAIAAALFGSGSA